MPLIEINGKKIEAETGAMIIEIADSCNIQIPRFCYHKKLSIAANCRMCLVEVEKAPKPLPACATPVTEGMKIWTHSPKALLAQKAVMEFLLINHPLDCPICDQGGECELQDLAVGYGKNDSRYTEGKRVIKDKNLGPLISTDMTRCIQCTRCVRFGAEIAGIRELGATGRGEETEIGTYIEKSVTSEVSGNIIDICPVGALTSKPFRFKARGWELKQIPTIAPHDCVGSNLFMHIQHHQVMRIVPKENESINEVWISDKDRFSYEGLYSKDRLQYPKIKKDGHWEIVSWEEVIEYTANKISEFVKIDPKNVGTLISPNSTVEECYLFQKLMRGLNIQNIDHRLRQSDFRYQNDAPLFPTLGIELAEIEQQALTLLVGSNVHKEQPIIGLKLRKMTLNGGKVIVINPVDFNFNFEVTEKSIIPQGDLRLGLAKLVKAIIKNQQNKNVLTINTNHLPGLEEVTPLDVDYAMARLLLESEKKLILLGALALSHPVYSEIISLAHLIAELTGAKLGILTDGANHGGAWIAGCVPHRLPGGQPSLQNGLSISEMWEKALAAYVLFNFEPHLDCFNGKKALQALQGAQCVIAMTSFEHQILHEVADVLLPLASFTETPGTFLNVEGKWQSFKAGITPLAESRPGWKILRVLGTLCHLEGFEYDTVEAVLVELKVKFGSLSTSNKKESFVIETKPFAEPGKIVRIAPIPLYATDSLVRKAKSLQGTLDAGSALLHLNGALAHRLKLVVGSKARIFSEDSSLALPFMIDERMPDNTVMVAAGLEETVDLGAPYAMVRVEPI